MLEIIFETIKKIFVKKSEYFRQIKPILLSVLIIIIVECVNDFSVVLSELEKSEYTSLYISVSNNSAVCLDYDEADAVLCRFDDCSKQISDEWTNGVTVSTLKEQKVIVHSVNRGYLLNFETDLKSGRIFSEKDENYYFPVAIIPDNLFSDAQKCIGDLIRIKTEDNNEYEFEIIGTCNGLSDNNDIFNIYVNYSYLLKQGLIDNNSQQTLLYRIPYYNSNEIIDFVRNYYDLNYPFADIKVSMSEETQGSNDITINVILIIVEFFLLIAFMIGNVGILTMSLIEVNKRSKEFGIKQAIGLKKSYIFLEITTENILLSMIGTVSGSVLGVFIGNLINCAIAVKFETNFSCFIFTVPFRMIGSTFIVAFAFSFVFSQIPVQKILKMNIIKIFTITASIAFLVACDKNIENVDITEQQLYEVKLQSAEDYILANGEIASSDEFCVFPPYSGTVSMVFKSVGESVVKGEKLFTYNTKELEKNKSELQKQFEQIKSETEYTHSINVRNLENAEYQKELNCSEAQCEINNTEADRDRIDEKIAAVSEELDYIAQQIAEAFDKNPTDLEIQYQQKVTEIEDLNEEYLRAVREVENAYMKYDAVVRESDKIIQEMKDVINGEKYDDKVSEYEVQINEIQKKIDNAVVFSGADGIITEMNITLGCDIQDQVALKIASPDSYVVLAHVNEENIENITIGMKSEISFVNNNNVFEGTVSKIYMVPDENQSTYPVEIDIDSNSNIFLGRSVSVKVYTEAKENIIMIPYDYLKKDNDGSVYVQKNSVNGAEEICVETGIKMVDKIEIISDTLKPGDKLIKFG